MAEQPKPKPKGTALVRQSKYRHLFGTAAQNVECVLSLKLGALQADANPVKVNSQFFAIPWVGNGNIAVVPRSQKGAIHPEHPLIEHEENTVNDFNFHPFDDHLLASACNDGTVAFWRIPEGGLTSTLSAPARTITASDKRLLSIEFHNLANNIALTIDAAKEVKLWDVEAGSQVHALPSVHKAQIANTAWSPQGDLLATAAKDKTLRVFDPRANQVVAEAEDHPGAKGSRVLWLNKKNWLFTVGFGKGNERQFAIYDPRNLSQRLTLQAIDSSSSTIFPFQDPDNSIVYLAGKGDGNIRYYEIVDEEPFIYYLNEFKSKDPQSGIALLPKQCNDVMKCETSVFVKVTPQGVAVPIRFEIPRKENMFFQDDIFPDTWDGKPSMQAAEWLSGANTPPNLMSLDPAKRQ